MKFSQSWIFILFLLAFFPSSAFALSDKANELLERIKNKKLEAPKDEAPSGGNLLPQKPSHFLIGLSKAEAIEKLGVPTYCNDASYYMKYGPFSTIGFDENGRIERIVNIPNSEVKARKMANQARKKYGICSPEKFNEVSINSFTTNFSSNSKSSVKYNFSNQSDVQRARDDYNSLNNNQKRAFEREFLIQGLQQKDPSLSRQEADEILRNSPYDPFKN